MLGSWRTPAEWKEREIHSKYIYIYILTNGCKKDKRDVFFIFGAVFKRRLGPKNPTQ